LIDVEIEGPLTAFSGPPRRTGGVGWSSSC
jgi:hypothetical protein